MTEGVFELRSSLEFLTERDTVIRAEKAIKNRIACRVVHAGGLRRAVAAEEQSDMVTVRLVTK